jgi:hypothetical protein
MFAASGVSPDVAGVLRALCVVMCTVSQVSAVRPMINHSCCCDVAVTLSFVCERYHAHERSYCNGTTFPTFVLLTCCNARLSLLCVQPSMMRPGGWSHTDEPSATFLLPYGMDVVLDDVYGGSNSPARCVLLYFGFNYSVWTLSTQICVLTVIRMCQCCRCRCRVCAHMSHCSLYVSCMCCEPLFGGTYCCVFRIGVLFWMLAVVSCILLAVLVCTR